MPNEIRNSELGIRNFELGINCCEQTMGGFGDFLTEKCLRSSTGICNLCKYLRKTKNEYNIANQLSRSGTSIGANVAEAQCAVSRNDFAFKLYISLKECNEALYWLDVLKRTDVLDEREYSSIYADGVEIKKILVSITKKLKTNN